MIGYNFCSLLFTFLNNKEKFIISNVYAPTTMLGRKMLWASLNQMRDTFRGICWIVAWDFNVSLFPSKKRDGIEGITDGMQYFINFVHKNELMDVELKKLKFTWTNARCGDTNI